MIETVQVLLFGRYAELAGAGAIQVPLSGPEPSTVAEVVAAVRTRVPQIPERPLCAVNRRQEQLSALVRPGDEIALLPPLAGG